MNGGEVWSREEVEAVVADYFQMLTQHLTGQSYNKSAHRRALKLKLRSRSDGSIERKHQNISAILNELECPAIPGYKPLHNYQGLLYQVVAERLGKDQLLDRAALSAVEQPAIAPALPQEFRDVFENPPLVYRVAEPEGEPYRIRRNAIRRDYLSREARNSSLGSAGEAFVVALERYRLASAGNSRLSDHVEHVSKTKGDGLGYDVLSFEADGRERFIEVKTTAFGKETPFFVSHNEASFSEEKPQEFHLYRVFDFRRRPRVFDLPGRVRDNVKLDPVSYLARFI